MQPLTPLTSCLAANSDRGRRIANCEWPRSREFSICACAGCELETANESDSRLEYSTESCAYVVSTDCQTDRNRRARPPAANNESREGYGQRAHLTLQRHTPCRGTSLMPKAHHLLPPRFAKGVLPEGSPSYCERCISKCSSPANCLTSIMSG